jgi:hypothetical protein
MKALMADKLVGTPGRALLVTGKFLSESMIQVDGQLFGSAWQVAPRDFPALNCPLVLHCNLADEKSETYVTLVECGPLLCVAGLRPKAERTCREDK